MAQRVSTNLKAEKKSRPISPHASDLSPELKRVARLIGQLEGIKRMIYEGRYCPDIIQQIKSAKSALRGLEISTMTTHLRSCVKSAIKSDDPFEAEAKITELITLMQSQ